MKQGAGTSSIRHGKSQHGIRKVRSAKLPLIFRDIRVLTWMLWKHVLALLLVVGGSTWYIGSVAWPEWPAHQALYATMRITGMDPDIPYAEVPTFFGRALYFILPMFILIAGLDMFRTVFSGLLERRRRSQDWERATVRQIKDHIVICGVGAVGSRIVKELCDAGHALKIVAIEYNEQSPGVLLARGYGVPVIIGNAQIGERLLDAGIERAACLVAAGDDDELNASIYLTASGLSPCGRELKAVLRCIDDEIPRLIKPGSYQSTKPQSCNLIFPEISKTVADSMLDSIHIKDVAPGTLKIAIVGLGKVGYVVVRHLVEKHGILPSQLTILDRAPDGSELYRLRKLKKFESVEVIKEDLSGFLARIEALDFTHVFVTTGTDLTYLICANSAQLGERSTVVRTKTRTPEVAPSSSVVAVNTTEVAAGLMVKALYELQPALHQPGTK